jgi:glycosyltransferase involved in cell wall biosynthesis
VKIVIEAFSARLGGGQTYLINLLDRLPEDPSLEVYLYAPATLALPIRPNLTRMTTLWPVTNPVLRVFWQLFILPWVLWREGVDVLFCPGGLVMTPAPPGCRVVTMFRNMIPFDARVRQAVTSPQQRARNWLLYRLMLRSMRRADLTIFISRYCRALLEGLTPMKHAETIYHGISSLFFTSGKVLGPPADLQAHGYLLYVSRFDVYKHHVQLVSAYASLPDALRLMFPLVLVGEANSAEANKVRRLIIDLKLDGRVRIEGSVAYGCLPNYYRNAAVNLFMSSCENCPNILLEAMGAGRPIVCSNIDPMPEFAGDAAVFVDPLSSESIASGLRGVLEDVRVQSDLAERAAKRAASYNWNETARRTWEALRRVC